jgi:hypothetical protein
MKTIWKFPLMIADRQEIVMPQGARLLSVGLQNGLMQLWAVVDPSRPKSTRTIAIVGTGHDMDSHEIERWFFVGTCITMGGRIVWHIFDAGET